MKIVVGSDHAGLHLKEHLKGIAEKLGHEIIDVGTHSEESTDYPDYGAAVGRKVIELEQAGAEVRGLCVCGSGIGISIAANKVPGVRAALAYNTTAARLARQHNNANVLCLGERVVGPSVAEDALTTFLDTAFEGGRHARRVDKLNALGKDAK
jgi:ribose 5-phosphate isomerase B